MDIIDIVIARKQAQSAVDARIYNKSEELDLPINDIEELMEYIKILENTSGNPTVDENPILNSNNLVKSGGVYSAIEHIKPKIIDNTLIFTE